MSKATIAGTHSLKGWGLKTFTRDELEQIHIATLEIMQSTGLRVVCDEALDIFKAGGCEVNKKTQVVKFPKHIVKQALSMCPSHILLAGRDPKNDFIMGGKKVGFTPFGTAVLTQDLDTGEVRDSTKDDVAKMAVLCDALENVDVFTPPVSPCDRPLTSYELHGAEASFLNTTKHIDTDAETGARCRKIIEMAAVIVGGTDELKKRPIVSFGTCPVSPLQLIRECCEVIIESARFSIPINVLSMAMAGATSPVSLAGTLVTHNVEVLGGIVLAQLTNPGTPVIYGSSTTTFNMKYGSAVVGAPEMGMISAAASELSNFYGIPSFVGGT
jgi:trimethylamine--corrinoid protein Co-methyltransferase